MKKSRERQKKELPSRQQQSELVLRHMQSHHRRIAEAKGRVDAAPPKALCCTKMRDRVKRDRDRSTRSNKRSSLQLTTNTQATASQSETTKTKAKEKALCEMETKLLPSNSPVSMNTLPLMESCCLEEKSGESMRWQLYHTQTGRLTGFLRERQRLRNRRQSNSVHLNPPWKPPYTSPARDPLARDTETKQQQKTSTPKPKKDDIKEIVPAGLVKQKREESVIKSGDTGESDSSYTSWSDASEDEEEEEEEEEKETVDGGTHQHTDNHLSAREMLLQGAEMRQRASILTERNAITKQEFQERELERCYLEFVSEVTQEILRRGVLTRPALDLLCQTHIHRHKHRLREDEMVKRLDKLKKQIGLS